MIDIKFEIQPNEFGKTSLEPNKYWEKLDLEILGHFFPKYPKRVENDLEVKGFIHKPILASEVEMIHFVKNKYSKTVELDDDADEAFMSTSFRKNGLLASYRKDSNFISPTVPLLSATHTILDSIKDDVAFQLGSPWKVLMARFWETKAGSLKENMYGWHADGMPHQFFKIMLYFGQMSLKHGSLELKVDGKDFLLQSKSSGSWVLFKNSSIFHRGIPPNELKNVRLACEITLCRSFNYEITPTYSGNNAHWPIFPWNTSMTNTPVKSTKEDPITSDINLDIIDEKLINQLDDLSPNEQSNLDLIFLIHKNK